MPCEWMVTYGSVLGEDRFEFFIGSAARDARDVEIVARVGALFRSTVAPNHWDQHEAVAVAEAGMDGSPSAVVGPFVATGRRAAAPFTSRAGRATVPAGSAIIARSLFPVYDRSRSEERRVGRGGSGNRSRESWVKGRDGKTRGSKTRGD